MPIDVGPVRTTLIELIAVAFGLMSVWSMKKESILAFPSGIINTGIYVYICFIQKLYALAGINVFFVLMSVYGWINWSKGSEDEILRISKCTRKQLILNLGAIPLFFGILWMILSRLTDSNVPGWDAITTTFYIIGMWFLAWKKIENWWLWIAGDTISIFLFGFEKLYFSSLQYFVFTIIAVFGYLEWKKKLISNESTVK
ncbi:MAG: nicotinamide riboside transporter PnuC [Bacteroidota bacterium]|nr:nicotinamide riboside transporter PnuC [Bacteroidota bacterium]